MIRIVRVLEYTYDTIEQALADQAHYQTGLNGVYKPNTYTTIRSATLPMEAIPEAAGDHDET